MLEQVKIITGRRAYEFRPDDLRLSMLSIKPIQDRIQQLFSFQGAAIGSPIPTFGDVPLTIPPGLVFTSGMWLSPDEQLVPIRFLNFEQRRIVIDVGGASYATSAIFELLQRLLSEMHASDGSPIVGDPESFLDYSEITAHFPSSLDTILVNPLHKLLTKAVGENATSGGSILVPTLAIQAYAATQQLAAVPGANDTRVFTLALRAGTRPDEHVYFSGAPLDTEAHLNYLNELEIALTS